MELYGAPSEDGLIVLASTVNNPFTDLPVLKFLIFTQYHKKQLLAGLLLHTVMGHSEVHPR